MIAGALTGRNVVVTQAGTSRRTTEELSGRGATVIEVPMIAIAPPEDWADVDDALASLESFDWIVFTSANAARFVAGRKAEIGDTAPVRARVAVVGNITRKAAEEVGWPVALCPAVEHGEGLVEAMIAHGALDGARVLFPKGNLARDVVPSGLRAAGAEVRETVVYQTLGAPINRATLLARVTNGTDAITFSSPSAVQHFVDGVGTDVWRVVPDRVVIASIGPTTSAALAKSGRQPDAEAATPSPEGLADAVERALGGTRT